MLEHIAILCRAFAETYVFRNARFAHFRAEALAQLLVDVPRHLAPRIEARDYKPFHRRLFQHALQCPQGLVDLQCAVDCKVVGGNRDQHAVARENSVQRQHPQHRTSIHQDGPLGIQVLFYDAGVQPVQRMRPFAELGIDLGQIEVRRDDGPARAAGAYQFRKRFCVLIIRVETVASFLNGNTADRRQMSLRIQIQNQG